METPGEQEASEYLKNHKIVELINNLTSMLLFYRPERPREFLITQLEQLKASRDHAVDSPCLFDDSNLDAVFGILDPTKQGNISYAQYKEALMTLGIKNFNECPEGLENDRISHETFKKEAKEALARSATTFQMVFKQPFKKKKTSTNEKILAADTYCQTVTMQFKMEDNSAEDLTNGKCSQTETGLCCCQPRLLGLKHTNPTLVCSTELGDPPLLRQPQHTTMTGIQQIIECFLSGTVQAKLTLLKEVDTIFECKLCRSLFRGLPNLLEHRRSYCLSRQPEPDDPTQVVEDLLDAVFPQRDQGEMSPFRTIPSPVPQDQPLTLPSYSHQQNAKKQCSREPVVVLRRFQQAHTAPDKEGLVTQETQGSEQIEREDDDGEEGSNNIKTLQKDFVEKAKIKPSSENLEGIGEACEEPLSSSGKRCHVCQKSFDKEENVHCRCSEVHRGLKQDCTTPVFVTKPGQCLSTQTKPVPQKRNNSKPVKVNPSSQNIANFSREDAIPWKKDIFHCGQCKCKYSSPVLLMKHMSIAHKFFVLENSFGVSRIPPPRKVKTNIKPSDKAFDNVRVYCWLCGKNFFSRSRVRSLCHEEHKEQLQEINMLLMEDTGLVHELHSLKNGFAASHKPPTPSLPAR